MIVVFCRLARLSYRLAAAMAPKGKVVLPFYRSSNFHWAWLTWGKLVAACCNDIGEAHFVARHSVIDLCGEEPLYLVPIPEYAILG